MDEREIRIDTRLAELERNDKALLIVIASLIECLDKAEQVETADVADMIGKWAQSRLPANDPALAQNLAGKASFLLASIPAGKRKQK